MKLTAYFFSYLFHPLIVPTIGIFIFFNTDSYINYAISKDLKRAIVMIIFITTCIMPLISTLLLLNRKVISSLEMQNKNERFIPYLSTLIFYGFTMYLLNETGIPPFINKFLLGATTSIALAMTINFKWKISAHMISIGGLIGALMAMALLFDLNLISYIILAILTAGFVGSSRLFLKAHSSMQLIAGLLVGILTQFVAIFWY